MKILALSGSLRRASSNAALLRAAAVLAPPGMEVRLYEGIGDLPLFNPDLDEEGMVPPPTVAAFRAALGASDGVLVSCPEYVHGVPGAFKNALDWIVSSGEFARPVLLLNPSGFRGAIAEAALIEILQTMEARVLVDATVRAPGLRGQVDEDGRVTVPELAAAIRAGLAVLAEAISFWKS